MKAKPTAVIIQARMASTRLPGKALLDVAGKPALVHVIERAKLANKVNEVILATTNNPEDRVLVKLAKDYGIKSFAGSENDVLDRYYQTAKKFKLGVVVRITGDCPLTDPQIIDRAISLQQKNNLDYVGFDPSFPDGLDVDVFSFPALAKAWREAKLPSEREHVAPYVYNHPQLFKIDKIRHHTNLQHLRWTLDEPKDLEFIRKVYGHAQRKKMKMFYMNDILQILEENPKLVSINKDIIRNEGYLKSLRQEKNDNSVKFVAEVSSNHNQDLGRAKKMIEASAAAGCWAVKFQLFKVDELFAPEILKKRPELRKRKNWELPVKFLPELVAHCRKLGIKFSCTPFYLKAVEELEPYVDFYKIASYELLWHPLLAACAKAGKPVVLSTGMATLPEIQAGVDVLVKNGCKDITLLHCTSAYPTPPDECNLKAIKTIGSKIRVNKKGVHFGVGWSDHSVSPAVIYRAVNRWQASMVEFHIDLEGKGAEANTGHCWRPEQIAPVIKTAATGLLSDGSGRKEPVPAELSDRDWRTDPSDGLRPFKKIRGL